MNEQVKPQFELVEYALAQEGIAYYTIDSSGDFILYPEHECGCEIHDGSPASWAILEALLRLHRVDVNVDFAGRDGGDGVVDD